MSEFVTIGGKNRELDGGVVTIGSTWRQLDKGWEVKNGIWQQIMSSVASTVGELPVGSLIKMNDFGSESNYLVLHHGLPSSIYDSSCDGTWLMRVEIPMLHMFTNGAYNNEYSQSSLHTDLNNVLYAIFNNAAIKALIKQVKIPYMNGSTARTGANGLSAYFFVLSSAEVFGSGRGDGAQLDYFKNGTVANRIAYYNGSAYEWLTRTPEYNSNVNAYGVSAEGGQSSAWINTSTGFRNAFIIPSDAPINAAQNSDGSFYLNV